ncbi:MAG: endonuclease VIII [Firmicutes bacterium]|nr:endonuclease VIII [Bacillota bacterium]
MIELPETHVLTKQINETLVGKTIKNAMANASPHAFAFYSGDCAAYGGMLAGAQIIKASTDFGGCGSQVEIMCDDMLLSLSTPIKYHKPGEKLPKSHQLLLEFDDSSHMSCTVQMWGGIHCVPFAQRPENKQVPCPYSDAFDEAYFDSLISGEKPNLSAKALLATEQRIPGLGNGVLQDILFNARIHPKRKLETLTDTDIQRLFRSVKSTLKEMRDEGGRDTEKDLFNKNGGYFSILSKNTLTHPCRECGSGLVRQAYLGGNIYFCPVCQPL